MLAGLVQRDLRRCSTAVRRRAQDRPHRAAQRIWTQLDELDNVGATLSRRVDPTTSLGSGPASRIAAADVAWVRKRVLQIRGWVQPRSRSNWSWRKLRSSAIRGHSSTLHIASASTSCRDGGHRLSSCSGRTRCQRLVKVQRSDECSTQFCNRPDQFFRSSAHIHRMCHHHSPCGCDLVPPRLHIS